MSVRVLQSVGAGWERRYDGPIPLLQPPDSSRCPLLDRLAGESRALLARRRRTLVGACVEGDAVLSLRSKDLAQYRSQAMELRQTG